MMPKEEEARSLAFLKLVSSFTPLLPALLYAYANGDVTRWYPRATPITEYASKEHLCLVG